MLPALLRVESEQSIWIIEPHRYMRLPTTEAPRRNVWLDEALDDGVWMPHRCVVAYRDEFGLRLRMLPAWRPRDPAGIVTGVIVGSAPPLEAASAGVARACDHDVTSRRDTSTEEA